MKCEADKIADEIKHKKDMSECEVLEKEVLLRRCIAACKNFNKTFNIFLVRRKRYQDILNDPTTGEENRRALGKKKKKKWYQRK